MNKNTTQRKKIKGRQCAEGLANITHSKYTRAVKPTNQTHNRNKFCARAFMSQSYLSGELLQTANVDRAFLAAIQIATAHAQVTCRADHATR